MTQATDSGLFEEAAHWYFRVRSAGLDSDVHTEWLAWVEANPAHRASFAEVQRIWDALGAAESPPWPTPEELADEAHAVAGSRSHVATAIAERATTLGRSGRRYGRRYGWAALSMSAALGVLVVLSIGIEPMSSWFAGRSQLDERIATARGEQQSAVLPDGSRLELGALTGVEVIFTPHRRLIVADEGEVFYKVSHDPKRPFVVEAGPLRVTAVGTAFSIRREGQAVSVVVTEGAVEVDANSHWEARTEGDIGSTARVVKLRAQAGQRVQFGALQNQPVLRPASTDAATVRGQRLLRFEDEPLSMVVASLNRYAKRRIVIADPDLAAMRFTGTVYYDSIEDWLAAVQLLFPAKLGEDDPELIVIQRSD